MKLALKNSIKIMSYSNQFSFQKFGVNSQRFSLLFLITKIKDEIFNEIDTYDTVINLIQDEESGDVLEDVPPIVEKVKKVSPQYETAKA